MLRVNNFELTVFEDIGVAQTRAPKKRGGPDGSHWFIANLKAELVRFVSAKAAPTVM